MLRTRLSWQRRRVAAWLAAAMVFGVLGGGLVVGSAGGARSSSVLLATFDAQGSFSWVVPAGVKKITVDVFGASGGNHADGHNLSAWGGTGGEAKGQFAVKPGQVFEIVVGGQGGQNFGSGNGAAGFNGGALGGSYSGGGGGASDLRIGGVGNPCVSDKTCAFTDRIVVGGGGGGAGSSAGFNGGAGGGVAGADAVSGGGTGGHQTNVSGKECPITSYLACFGLGGDNRVYFGGGGGGGWYGGNADDNPCCASGSGGGGGSGYVSSLARKGSFPGGIHDGDGLVKITTP